jgi:Holliday junction resolvase-like predicted endonuclease
MDKPKIGLEERRLQEVAREYRGKGYEVIVRPDRSVLPDFLAQYEIDMIARSEEEQVVVEVKSKSSLSQADYLQSLADRVQKHSGWRFELVITNPKEESVSKDEPHLLSELALMQRIGEIRGLLAEDHKEAALLMGWATAEGALRLVAKREGVSLQRQSPSYVMKYMTSIGLLDQNDFASLQDMLTMRNEVVHGFKLRRFNRKKFEDFLETIKTILATRGDV